MQPQLGQVSFSLEIEMFVSVTFGFLVIMIICFNLIVNNIAYKINHGNKSYFFLKKN